VNLPEDQRELPTGRAMGFRNHNKVPSNILLHRRADYAASRSASERERKTLRGEAARACSGIGVGPCAKGVPPATPPPSAEGAPTGLHHSRVFGRLD
jgi:hypothetical protein